VNINANDQNIITKQDYVPEIAIGVLADVVTKQYKYLRALIDSGSLQLLNYLRILHA
jgi:hypothetical protein